MSIIIAGERSGVGKTTVTLALLAYLQQQGTVTQSFKVGPDYIDPMFHYYVTDRPCRNLDPVLTSAAYVRECFARHTQAVECALVEGVMGLFDGAAETIGQGDWGVGKTEAVGRGGIGSTAHVARLLKLPVVLVVDCSRMSQSIAALIHGYTTFDPDLQFAGLVLNRVGSDRHLELLQAALAPLPIPILGVLRRQAAIAIPDRHLGLIPTAELPELDALLQQLAQLAKESFDWQRLMPLVRAEGGGRNREEEGGSGREEVRLRRERSTERSQESGFDVSAQPNGVRSQESRGAGRGRERRNPTVRIAIARDAAFSFYYADNLEVLATLGAELVTWSPLQDAGLPANVQGLILGGGFPEVFAAQLAANQGAIAAVRQAIAAGMPTYAECGGLMYLCQQIVDFAGQGWDLVGVLPATAVMGQRLTLGYRQITALQTGVMFESGAIAVGHEFHRSQLLQSESPSLFQINHQPRREGWHRSQLHASYVHLHWGAMPHLPQRFLRQCTQFQGVG